jgi:hypothetical protein
MKPARITNVRHGRDSALELLQDFIFGGLFGIGRVPRGIEPAWVADFILERLVPESSQNAFGKALDAMRFYDAGHALPRLEEALTGLETLEADLRRSCFVLQAMAEFAPERRVQAVDYLERYLAGLHSLPDALPRVLELLVVAAPAGGFGVVEAHLANALARLPVPTSEDEMLSQDRVLALQHNELPRARALAEAKAWLMALPEPQRTAGCVRAYLGLDDAGGLLMESLVGRVLRSRAMKGDQAEVLAAFESELNVVLASGAAADDVDFVVTRGAQAMIYLGADLSPAIEYRYRARAMAAAHFLWDDPE